MRDALAAAMLLLAASGPVFAEGGTIRGQVTLASPAPPNPVIRMGADPACSRLWTTERPTQTFVVRGSNGELANVFVQLGGEFATTPPPATSVVIDQRHCLYQPHVVAVRAGQALEIRNSDPTTHNVHSVSSAHNDFNVSRPAESAPLRIAVEHPELMMRLTCDIHSWMNLFVAVVSHPYFAVTDSRGSFEIRNVPPGHRTVQVWHERYGPKSIDVDVIEGAVRDITVVYAGTERPGTLSSLASIVVPANRPVILAGAPAK